jgi:hypothetical protein
MAFSGVIERMVGGEAGWPRAGVSIANGGIAGGVRRV